MSLRSKSECSHFVGTAAAGTTSIVAAPSAAAGVFIPAATTRIYKMIITVSATATLVIQDTGSNVLSQTFSFGTNGGSITIDIPINGEPWWVSGAGLGIQFVVTGATINADVWYLQGV